MTSNPLPPRGWYNDPHVPGQDRWWDGTQWTRYTHGTNSVRYSMFGPSYARAWWVGPNRAASLSLLLSRIAVLSIVVGFIVVIVLRGLESSSLPAAVFFTIVSFLAFGTCVAGLVFGILGSRRSSALGGTLPAVWGTGLSAVGILVAGAIVTLLLLAAFRAP